MTTRLDPVTDAPPMAWGGRPDDWVEAEFCGACGQATHEPLVIAAMTLALRALEVLGKRIVRDGGRSRYLELGDDPWEVAHTRWRPTNGMVEAALCGAWDHLDLVVQVYAVEATPTEVVRAMDRTVRDAVNERRVLTLGQVRMALLPYLDAGG